LTRILIFRRKVKKKKEKKKEKKKRQGKPRITEVNFGILLLTQFRAIYSYHVMVPDKKKRENFSLKFWFKNR